MWKWDRNPRIYLAGKIAHTDWRHAVVKGGLRGVINDCDLMEAVHPWPMVVGGVCDIFDYVGPYFVGCDHGCGHGQATHGYGTRGCIQWPVHEPRYFARMNCIQAIKHCDVFYAWLDDTSAHGTLVEIGYAEALGKILVLDGPYAHMSAENGNEMWFAAYANWHVTFPRREWGAEPVESVRNFCATWAQDNPKLESEIEYAFWAEYRRLAPSASWDLRPALPVVGADGKNYRLDFAEPNLKVAIELDGHAWHSGKDVFVKDRQRQRALTASGWTFLRFAGREVMESPTKCAKEVIAYLDNAARAGRT